MLDAATKERIDADIASEDVVLFMKGTPVFPQCGFSAAVVGVLSHLGVKFRGINVLEDDAIREGIKAYSDWPTIPQLYVKREFVGGCDIIREMYETGELTEMLRHTALTRILPDQTGNLVTQLYVQKMRGHR